MMDLVLNEDVPAEMVWIDLETLGTNEKSHPIVEIGGIVTDRRGEERSRFSSVVGYSSEYLLPRLAPETLAPAVYEMHTKNDLLAEVVVACSQIDAGHLEHRRPEVERQFIEWLDIVTNGAGQYAMCGASIHFDRRFLAAQMPRLESWFHYRNYDISTIIALGKFVNNKCTIEKRGIHRALPDCEDEISAQKWAVGDLVRVA